MLVRAEWHVGAGIGVLQSTDKFMRLPTINHLLPDLITQLWPAQKIAAAGDLWVIKQRQAHVGTVRSKIGPDA